MIDTSGLEENISEIVSSDGEVLGDVKKKNGNCVVMRIYEKPADFRVALPLAFFKKIVNRKGYLKLSGEDFRDFAEYCPKDFKNYLEHESETLYWDGPLIKEISLDWKGRMFKIFINRETFTLLFSILFLSFLFAPAVSFAYAGIMDTEFDWIIGFLTAYIAIGTVGGAFGFLYLNYGKRPEVVMCLKHYGDAPDSIKDAKRKSPNDVKVFPLRVKNVGSRVAKSCEVRLEVLNSQKKEIYQCVVHWKRKKEGMLSKLSDEYVLVSLPRDIHVGTCEDLDIISVRRDTSKNREISLLLSPDHSHEVSVKVGNILSAAEFLRVRVHGENIFPRAWRVKLDFFQENKGSEDTKNKG